MKDTTEIAPVIALKQAEAIIDNSGGGGAPQQEPSFHERVKALRAKLGLTQEQFADRYDLELSTIKNWEQGRRKNVGAAALLVIKMIEKDPEGMAERVLECS
jgi:putative transcriptional regulator